MTMFLKSMIPFIFIIQIILFITALSNGQEQILDDEDYDGCPFCRGRIDFEPILRRQVA